MHVSHCTEADMETTDVARDTGRDAIEQELIAAERRYWQALQDNDVETAMSLTDFPCLVTGPQGIGMVDEKTFASMMKEAQYSVDRFRFGDDVKVRVVSDDVAIVAYTAHEELTVEGAQVLLDLVDASTWIRRDGAWRCAVHTESIAGDPFGRDRLPAQ